MFKDHTIGIHYSDRLKVLLNNLKDGHKMAAKMHSDNELNSIPLVNGLTPPLMYYLYTGCTLLLI